MFGKLFSKPAPQAAKAAPAPVHPVEAPKLDPLKLAIATELLTTVGLLDPEWFKDAVVRPSGFFGGSLEWSQRETDMRIIVNGWPGGEITRIWATPLKGAHNSLYSDEKIEEVNELLARIIAI